MSNLDRSTLLEFALSLAATAETQILRYYYDHTVQLKADGSVVTQADREAELAMRQQIEQQFPDHGILGEEFGEKAGADSRYQWILDPVDGTVWFTVGLPIFGTLIALLEDGQPIVGVIHLPGIGETVYAAKSMGCWFKTKTTEPVQVHVQPKAQLQEAFVSSSGVHSSDVNCRPHETPYPLTKIIAQAGGFRSCGDCSQYALVCRGKIQAAIDPVMNPWDIAAIIPCIEEAGGTVTSLRGETDNVTFSGSLLATCGGPLHQEILEIVRVGG